MGILTNPWVVGIGVAVIAGLILYFVFGIEKPKRKHHSHNPDTITQKDIQQIGQTALPSLSIGNENRNITVLQNIHQNTQVIPPAVNDETLKSFLSPVEIFEYVDSLPPLQKETAAQNYKGIKVSWIVNLHGGWPQTDGTLFLMMQHHGLRRYYWVYCSIDPNQYPQVKVITSDKQFTVEGTIEKVGSGDITLINCRLLF